MQIKKSALQDRLHAGCSKRVAVESSVDVLDFAFLDDAVERSAVNLKVQVKG